MIKLKNKKIHSLAKNFQMVLYQPIILPSLIRDKDIYAMFTGLMTLVRSQANNQAKQQSEHSNFAYNYLLKLYKQAVKEKNMYKSLYLKLNNKETA